MTVVYEPREGSEYQEYDELVVEFRRPSHRYYLVRDDKRVPAVSVTSALKVLDKPALLQWAESCGAEGAALLAARGELQGDPSVAIDAVRLNGLGMDAKRDAGADRGTAVHEVLELWAREEAVPNLADFSPEVRGYVQGLCSWLLEKRPKPTGIERFVGSVEHGFAGRLDMRALIGGRDCIVDLKTSRQARAFPEAHVQSQAYALADMECGSPPPDGVVVVAVGADGSFVQVDSEATTRDWLAVLACYRSMTRLRGDLRRLARAAA